jgi:penicillin-binding protein 2
MRERILNTAINLSFLLVIGGLLYTQVFRFAHYNTLSRNNAIRIIPIDGPRGRILDREGKLLVTNRLSFNVALIYQELKSRERLIELLNGTLGIPRKDLIAAIDSAAEKPYVPVTILEDIGKEKAIALEEAASGMNGIIMETRCMRHYPLAGSGAHLFGYVSEIGESELESFWDYGYRPRDLVGRTGLEEYYEIYLKGVNGGMQVEVDNRGRQVRVLGMKEPSHGRDLFSTIDAGLQAECDRLLADRAGAIIVMDPGSGEVLALVSRPAFDPNVFVKPSGSRERLKLLKDERARPLLDRAIAGLYPPGSVFKIVTATAALETRKINKLTHFFCAGSFKLGRSKFDCWKESGHSSQEVTGGLKNSCNVFFYQTGLAAGPDAIEAAARLFGFGRPTGIDLPDEGAGVVPGRMWKRIRRKDNWYEGETLNYSIGQGYLLVTPLQILQMMSAMANKGCVVRPHVVRRIDSTDIAGVKRRRLGLKDETIRLIREGLFKVVNDEDGTGKRSRVEGAAIAGKTGTAQNPHGRTHAWFSGFAPFDDPKICLVVFLEHGGKGGLEPAGIAGEIFKTAKKRGYL